MKKALYLAIVVVMFGMTLANADVSVEQVMSTILACGLQESSRLHEFQLTDQGLREKTDGTYVKNVSVGPENEIRFDLVGVNGNGIRYTMSSKKKSIVVGRCYKKTPLWEAVHAATQ